MITYSYKCTECGAVFDEQHRFCKQPDIAVCPRCGEEAVRYLGNITPHIHFIGWDWTRKGLLDPMSDDPRLDPGYFDDLLEDTDSGPKSFFQPGG